MRALWKEMTDGEPWPIKLMCGWLLGTMVLLMMATVFGTVMLILGITNVVPFGSGFWGSGGSHGVIIIGGHPYFH